MTTTPFARPPTTSGLVQRVWPEPVTPVRPAPLAAAGTAGAVAALALPDAPPGAGLVLVGALAAAVVALQRPRPWSRPELGLAALAGGLLGVAAVRAAEGLVALCLLAALGLGALAVSSARSWTGALLTPAAGPLAALRALPWAARATSPTGGDRVRWVPVLRTAREVRCPRG